jgi:hypothetical protein
MRNDRIITIFDSGNALFQHLIDIVAGVFLRGAFLIRGEPVGFIPALIGADSDTAEVYRQQKRQDFFGGNHA